MARNVRLSSLLIISCYLTLNALNKIFTVTRGLKVIESSANTWLMYNNLQSSDQRHQLKTSCV